MAACSLKPRPIFRQREDCRHFNLNKVQDIAMSLFLAGQWMLYRQKTPLALATQTTINFGLTMAFPKLKDYWTR